MNNPAIDEILQDIYMDYPFPVFFNHRIVNLILSRDVMNDLHLTGLNLVEEYTAGAAKSDKTFVISKTMSAFEMKNNQLSQPFAMKFQAMEYLNE